MSGDNLEARCAALAEALSLGAPVRRVVPLIGGVASDIARVDLGDGTLCMKFALPKLRVAEDWHAPVHRNAAEYAWLEVAGRIAPEAVPRLYGRSEPLYGFAMEFLEGPDVRLWKARLLAGVPDDGQAAAVGDVLGRIHAASAVPGFDAAPFHNMADFVALRIEPYLTFSARRHPDRAEALTALARIQVEGGRVLVHGDVSPKNILLRGGRPILLDAECATMGDASFDPAFCLNHLALKAVHLPAARTGLLAAIGAFWSAYAPHVGWEAPAALEARVARLLPGLMLARVDGKSPVEYLTDAGRGRVRDLARGLLVNPPPTLADLGEYLRHRLGDAA